MYEMYETIMFALSCMASYKLAGHTSQKVYDKQKKQYSYTSFF